MRTLAALRMVWASVVWMAAEMLATWCVRKVRGDARPSPYRVLSVAPGRRVCARVSRVCPVCVPAPPGVFELVPVLYFEISD